MKDLKHLIYFENLLQEVNNELVRQAKEEGRLALGYTCYFMPEVLLDLPGCFSVRLRAPRSTSPDIATYYMTNRTCSYGRSLLERALEGGYNFLDAEMATETCTVTCRFQEHLQMMPVIQNPNSSARSSTCRTKRAARPTSTTACSCRSTCSTPCARPTAPTPPTRPSAPPSASTTNSAAS
jgi:benzoyl-CoA reductase/2-hydroxyglutaryl-CoA dehydratase subunit BcrC/BadD/HgdB